jgi:hypothetical protein
MLVVTSNWGLTDGTLAGGAAHALVRRLQGEVQRAAWRCGMRQDGRYRPIESVDLVLAGDTFDWLVSREWTAAVKPWQSGPRAAAARNRVVEAAARRGCRFRAVLAGWARRGIAVPAADRRGRPVPGAEIRVPVRVTALRGDRDRWLDRLPAASTSLLPGAAVGISWAAGGVTVLHGESLDPLHENGADGPTIGESLVVDLIAAFGVALAGLPEVRPQAAAIVHKLVTGPVLDAPARLLGWLEADERGGRLPVASRGRLVGRWNEAVAQWHKQARRLVPRGLDCVDVIGQIAAGLEIDPATGPLAAVRHRQGAVAPGAGTRPAEVVMLGHAFDRRGGSWPQGVACLAAGPEDHWPPLAVVASDHGGQLGSRLEWLGRSVPVGDCAGCHEEGPGGRSVRGVWLSDCPESARVFVDAA